MKKLIIWSAFLGGSLLAVALSVVIWFGMNRVVVIADTGSVSDLTGVMDFEELSGHELPGRELSLQKGIYNSGDEEDKSIRIPMESAIGPENITMENQYMDRRLVMYIRGATGFFYDNNIITGYVDPVQAASYTVQSEGVTLYLQLSELYEYESILDKGYLQINLYKPSERYEKVVVLDAEVSDDLDEQEKAALYKIEEKLQVLLEAEGIRVYSTSNQSKDTGTESKLALIEQTKAKLYVGLMFDRDEDSEKFGSYVCYNSLYFRPWMTNGSFADCMEKELVTAISGKAAGLVELEDGLLEELSIPAVIVCPGYVSHETEGRLLLKESYQDKIAEGLFAGINKTFAELEKNQQ